MELPCMPSVGWVESCGEIIFPSGRVLLIGIIALALTILLLYFLIKSKRKK